MIPKHQRALAEYEAGIEAFPQGDFRKASAHLVAARKCVVEGAEVGVFRFRPDQVVHEVS